MTNRSVKTARIGVIGAGIVGLSVARRLQQATMAEVTVIDKEARVAAHQTGHNSNVRAFGCRLSAWVAQGEAVPARG